MKKYNTPEINVSMFDVETVLTQSGALADFNEFVEAGAQFKQFSFADLDQIAVTF